MTQAKYSDAFDFSLAAVKQCDGGRRTTEASDRAILPVVTVEQCCFWLLSLYNDEARNLLNSKRFWSRG